ncbi:response regulator [Telmatospirillum siberiense]|nr:response regulator [Telmatospirillum siberiense]
MSESMARSRESEMNGAPPHILVVDDGITMRMFYRSVLEAAGFMVEEATNGMEGYEKVLAQPFDLMIVDINMPKMDGYSMIRTIRNDPAVRMIPAVVVSTEAAAKDSARALEAGANFYLVKPVAPEDLTEVVRMIVGVAA